MENMELTVRSAFRMLAQQEYRLNESFAEVKTAR